MRSRKRLEAVLSRAPQLTLESSDFTLSKMGLLMKWGAHNLLTKYSLSKYLISTALDTRVSMWAMKGQKSLPLLTLPCRVQEWGSNGRTKNKGKNIMGISDTREEYIILWAPEVEIEWMIKWMNKQTDRKYSHPNLRAWHVCHTWCSKSRILKCRAMNFLTFMSKWKGRLERGGGGSRSENRNEFSLKNPRVLPLEITYSKINAISNNVGSFWLGQATSKSLYIRMTQEERNLGEKKK